MPPKVFITRVIPEKGVSMLRKHGYEVTVGGNKKIEDKELKRQAQGVQGLLCLLTDRIDESVMDAIGPQLKIISNYAVGYDNIDIEAAKKRGIIVTNTPDVLTESVAEHAITLLLALARRLVEANRFTKNKKYRGWEPELLLGSEMQGKTLGIVGHGRIGCRTAEIAYKGFGMKTVYYDVYGEEAHDPCGAQKRSLEELLQESDAVSLHVPLLDATHHLIDEEKLAVMKSTAYLINTARGPVIKEKALLEAIKKKTIAGAGLDVFEHEPKFTKGLEKFINVILTPHIASATHEARESMSVLAARNIIEAFNGKDPEHTVG